MNSEVTDASTLATRKKIQQGMRKVVHVKLDLWTYEALRKIAKQERRAINWVAREALEARVMHGDRERR